MSITIERIGWEDEPSEATPIDAGNLKAMEDNTENGINAAITQITSNNIIYATNSAEYTIQKTNTYEEVPLSENIKLGDKLTLTDNHIYIGTGIKYIKVSYDCVLQISNNSQKYVTLYKNDNQQVAFANASPGDSNNKRIMISKTPIILEVQEGDNFSVDVYGSQGEVISASRLTILIEAIQQVNQDEGI